MMSTTNHNRAMVVIWIVIVMMSTKATLHAEACCNNSQYK